MAFLLALVRSASTAWLYSWFHFFTQLWASFCLIPPVCVWCLQTSSLHFQTLSNWGEQPDPLHPWTPAFFSPHFPYPWMQSSIKSILFPSWHPVSIVSDSSSQYLPGLYSLPFSAAWVGKGLLRGVSCAGTRRACCQPVPDTAAPTAALLGCCSASVQGTGDTGSCVTSVACQWFTEISWSALFLGTAFLDKCFSNSKRRFDVLGNKPLPSCGF